MFHPRKLLVIVGLALLLIGGASAWRAAHPPLSPEAQIVANLDDFKGQIEKRNVGGTMGYLAPGFDWNGTPRDDIKRAMKATFFGWRDVKIDLSGVKVQVSGESATSTGRFSLSYKPSPDAPPETRRGEFKLFWAQRDGRWKVVKAEGAQEAQNL